MTLTAAGPVNIGSSRFVRSGKMPSTGLKIRTQETALVTTISANKTEGKKKS
jgi:hypothetical protein